ncbi:MAG: TraB/GumN family protein [Planctomycetes bacterium]|nr:TraB/GumN family protein [Planctomycetota bacterium]
MIPKPRKSWSSLFALFAVTALLLPRLLVAQAPTPAEKSAAPPTAAAPTRIERPLLWRIELPTPSYLYGTIHLADERVTELPPVVDEALERCDALYTELPMDMALLLKQMGRMQLPEGTTLRGLLGDALYDDVAAFVRQKGASMAMLDRMQPWAVGAQLGLIDQMKQMAGKPPLDMVIYQRAKRAGKKVGGLETVEEQVAVFADMTVEEQRTYVSDALANIRAEEAAGKNPTDELLRLYLQGDEAAIEAKVLEFPLTDAKLKKRLMARLVDDRNVAMADRIVRKLQEAPERAQAFAVGAAHYPGKMGVLELLRQRGYRLTRIELAADAAARAAEAAAVDAVIADRQRELEALRARRTKLAEAGAK